MSYWEYNENPSKINKQLKKCSVCGSRGKLTYRSRMGNHRLNDKIWFKAVCTGCDAETDETEDRWSDETAIKRWNAGDVDVSKGTIKRIKEIRELKAENKKLRKGIK